MIDITDKDLKEFKDKIDKAQNDIYKLKALYLWSIAISMIIVLIKSKF